MPLNFGKWENGENPKPGIPKKGEGEGHLTPAPTVEAFRSDLSAEPHQEAHGRAGKLVLSNFHQVESPVFNAKQVSCRWHLCAAERRGRGGHLKRLLYKRSDPTYMGRNKLEGCPLRDWK